MSAAPTPTDAQRRAIESEGDVLVVAAAGAGKTRTLVERCLDRVLRPIDPVSLEEVLLVTFTEAAAGEMRKRIRAELERRLAAAPENVRLAEQLALLDTAAITTLHSFCLRLVREHFYELQLDPQVAVLDDAQSRALAQESLDRLLQRHYAGTAPDNEAVRDLILAHGGGRDESLRALVLRLHHHTQTLPDPARWRREQLAAAGPGGAACWEQWLLASLVEWRREWSAALEPIAGENPKASACLAVLAARAGVDSPLLDRDAAARLLEELLAQDAEWKHGTKTKLRPALARLFDEAGFLLEVTRCPAGQPDPLAEDFEWVRPHLQTLVRLAEAFDAEFARAKREAGGVDFHDLEQFALQLLWDRERNAPSPIAAHWRARLRLVFVDEYQDINAAQDCLITALSREALGAADAGGNRFLVGDVKQSIYRFRLADPRIIMERERNWRAGRPGAQVIALSENFRSHETILQFINPVFDTLLRTEVGGVSYPAEARLRFGAPAARPELATATDPAPRVELHLRLTGGEANGTADEDGASDLAELGDAEKEARPLALRLRELKESRTPVWQGRERGWQPVEWRDMVVLLRSPHSRAECFAREFARLGVPLEVARGGFYETSEVTDLLSLLQLLDNPLQDVPVLAVLHSPLAGLTPEELAVIRLARRRGRFWLALVEFQRTAARMPEQFPEPALSAAIASARPKVDAFLQAFGRWRQLARQGALSHCLETVLDESHYEDWLLAQPRGAQRRANVERLLTMTRKFDPYQRQGLFRFLKFVDAQIGLEVNPAAAQEADTDTVRLMSIHQSKGQEFPVVALANLGGKFNFADLTDGIILDEEYGLCPQVKPPATEQRYPSLPYWLAARRQRREAIGEELRLLYVALTRACDRLILSGTSSRQRAQERWSGAPLAQLGVRALLESNCALDWLGPLLPALTGRADWADFSASTHGPLAWRVWSDAELTTLPLPPKLNAALTPSPAELAAAFSRLQWNYPSPAATGEPAKTSVSAFRKRLDAELADEARPLFPEKRTRGKAAAGQLTAAEVGTAHHRFLQFVAWDQLEGEANLRAEAARLTDAAVLTAEEARALDYAALAEFWRSEIGRAIRGSGEAQRHRELTFTARFTPAELAELAPALTTKLAPEEFIVVQGVADLAVIQREEIWLLDFKTDHFASAELEAKRAHHGAQLRLYAAALGRIYRRPVTKRWLHFLALRQTCEV